MMFGTCSGLATMVSQYWGVGERDKIKHSYGLALTLGATVALILCLLLALFPSLLMSVFSDEAAVISAGASYLRIYAHSALLTAYTQITCAALRATERVYVPLIASGAGVLVNTVLNYILIYGKFGMSPLGVSGAAVASVISMAVQTVIVAVGANRKSSAIGGGLRELFGYSREFVRKYLRISIPALLNETVWAVGSNVYIMVYARQGIENHSGYTVYETAQQLFFVFFVGMCHACAIIVGKSVGAGEHSKAYDVAKKFLIFTPLLGVVLGAVLILIRTPLLTVLPIETEEARSVASSLLLFFGFWIGVRNIQYTAICGVFRAGGDTKTGFFLDAGGMFLCGIPTVLVLGLVVKIPFVPLVMSMYFAEDIPKLIMCVKHFTSRKWIKQITSASVADD